TLTLQFGGTVRSAVNRAANSSIDDDGKLEAKAVLKETMSEF
ncbi:7627_t:CDS:1, partial [Funneliformis caledonium]